MLNIAIAMADFWLADLNALYRRRHPKVLRVLVLEDDVFLKPLMRGIVQSVVPGAEIHWLTSVLEAQALLKKKKIHLIIADCLLGGESGIALWDICKAKHPKTPMMMMSGLALESFQKLVGENRTVPPFVQKPLNIRECRGMIADFLTNPLAGGRA